MTKEELYELFLSTEQGDESLLEMEKIVRANMSKMKIDEDIREFIIEQAARGHEIGYVSCAVSFTNWVLTSLNDGSLDLVKNIED